MMPDAAPPSARALRRAPERREAALLLGTVLLLYIPGGFLQLTNLRWGLLVTQLCFVATPVFLAIKVFYLDGRAILCLRRPRAVHLCGAVLGTAGVNHVLNSVVLWQDRFFPMPRFVKQTFESLVAFHGPGDFLVLVFVAAVVPSVCEEILFRGFVHAALMREFESASKAIVTGAFVFAGFHLIPWRFPELLAIGLFLGYLVHRTGSLVPAMVAHGLNNALSLGLAGMDEGAQAFLLHSPWVHAGAAACLAAAALLLRRGVLWPPGERVI